MAAAHDRRRPSRPGVPRDPGPDRRAPRGADARWELWNLRALWPDAGPDDLADLKARRAALLAREREALAGLWAGDGVILAPGHGFLAANRGLERGIVVSLHQGPYQLLLEIFLAAGYSPLVLVSAAARQRNQERAEALATRLGHRGRIVWLEVESRAALRRLLEAARTDQPVIAYLDGNLGQDGFAGTRDRGVPYQLPGREIRVRTGLARLAARLACPLHPVAVSWGDDGLPRWTRGQTLRAGPQDDPAVVTRRLYDWCFSEVLARPEQWRLWLMLKESSACFARTRPEGGSVPAGLRGDYARAFRACCARAPETVRLCLEREVEVWPGDVLADLTADNFYAAAGLQDEDLEPLRAGEPSLAELIRCHGESWVGFHGLRLCLLGMARLGG